MTTSLSMISGIAFVVLAIVAVLLQAWLWNPKYWDPVAKKSHAPPFWMGVHRAVGYAYAILYVVMMVEMVPRLWEYQIELPARTVVHATCAIAIGVVLITKIAILRFFRHFEESMPALGLVLLVCTVVLGTLSIPFALRAHGTDAAFGETNRSRVATILGRLPEGSLGTRTAEELSTVDALYRGREVVMQRCATCHDLRTVLAQPRTGNGWLSLNRRMQDKPTLGSPLTDDEVLFATAYLVAITPQLRESVRERRAIDASRELLDEALDEPDEADEGSDEAPASVDAGVIDAGVMDAGVVDAGRVEEIDAGTARRARPRRRDAGTPDAGMARAVLDERPVTPPRTDPPPTTAVPDAGVRATYSVALARQILDRRCTDCHGLDDLTAHGGDDRDGWSRVLRRMIAQGAELTDDETRIVLRYLATTYPAVP